jgi:UDP-3-O-[3-hydroxymyristoyl] glucosamine N-acyltransferase
MENRFHRNSGPYTLAFIAEYLNATLPETAKDILIKNIRSIGEASTGDITFIDNPKYLRQLDASKATACIVTENPFVTKNKNVILLKVKNPYYAYSRLVALFYSPKQDYAPGIASSAYVAPSAKIGNNCHIGHNAVIEKDVIIGDDCVIGSGTVIEQGVIIGKRAMIYSTVSISYAEIGDDVVILPGARIGQDGFGFATEAGVHKKIYHTGKVVIGNNVEIGANTTVDRGSMSNTVIGDLCRIDNLVQIAHSVKLGQGSVIVAQVGIAGSTEIGNYCVLGGQVGIAGHLKIAAGSKFAGQSGVMKDVEVTGDFGGSPSMPIKDWHRQTVVLKNLTEEMKKK